MAFDNWGIRQMIDKEIKGAIDKIVDDDQISNAGKFVALKTIDQYACQLAATALDGKDISSEDWRELREYAEFEIRFQARNAWLHL